MQVQLVESADSVDVALGMVKERAEAAKQLLQDLEAEDIELGEFVLSDLDDSDSHGQAKMAKRTAEVIARRQAFGRPTPTNPAQSDADAKVQMGLSAQWSLAGDSDEALLFVAKLRRALADIGGAGSEDEETTPVWSTPAEEMQALMSAAKGSRNVCIPRFFFVSRLSEEQRDKALAEAFERARETAERLARAAGRKLGELKHLSESPHLDHSAQRSQVRQQLSGEEWPESSHTAYEIVWDDLRAGRFVVSVSTSFELL
jgi:hypothetical protein